MAAQMNTQQGGDNGAASSPLADGRASGSSSLQIPTLPFDGQKSKFAGWSIQMRTVFDFMDLWIVVEKPLAGAATARSVIAANAADAADEIKAAGDDRSVGSASADGAAPSATMVKKAKQAHMILLVNIKSEELLAQLADVPMGNPHELWRRLHAYYSRNTQANKQQMKSEFFNMKQTNGESVAAYAARLKKSVLALRDLDEAPSQADMLYAFSNGLNSSFSQFRTMMTMMPQSDLETMVDMALALESQAAASERQGSQRANGQESAHFAGGNNRPSFQGGDRRGAGSGSGGKQGACWRCGQVGHSKRECPVAPNTLKCNYCDRDGHVESVCHTKARGGPRGGAGQGAGRSAGAGNGQPGPRQAAMLTAAASEQVAAQLFVAIATSKATNAGAFAVGVSTKEGETHHSDWLLDTAATSHFATQEVPMQDAATDASMNIEVANGAQLSSPEVGTVSLNTNDGVPIILTKVLRHSGLSRRLLSVPQMCDLGHKVVFTKAGAEVIDENQKVILRASRPPGGLWGITAQAHAAVDSTVLHARMAHLSESGMKKLQDAKAVAGLDGHDAACNSEKLCAGCLKGKAHRESFAKAMSQRVAATRPLERVHADLCGPMPDSFGGSKYMLLIVDEFTRKVFGFPLKKKSDAAEIIVEWCRAAAAMQKASIGEFHSDGGGEFRSTELLKFFSENGITPTTTLAGTPQHNGIVERMNRTLLEKMVACMEHAGATELLWAEALKAVIHAHNHTVLRVGTQEVPEGLWRPHPTVKPSIDHLRVPFCDGWMMIPAEQRQGKLAPKAELRMVLGYDDQKRGYRMMNVHTRDVKLSRDVRFDEKSFTQCAELLKQEGGSPASVQSFAEHFSNTNFDNEMRLVQKISLEEHQAAVEAARRNNNAEVPGGQGGAVDQQRASTAEAAPKEPSGPIGSAGAPVSAPRAQAAEPRRGLRLRLPSEKVRDVQEATTAAAAPVKIIGDRGVRFTQDGKVIAKVPGPSAAGALAQDQASSSVAAKPAAAAVTVQDDDDLDDESQSDESFRPHHRDDRSLQENAELRRSVRATAVTNHYGMVSEGDVGAEGYSTIAHHVAMAATESKREVIGADDPKTFAEAMSSPDREQWIGAVKSEMRSMRQKHVWDLMGLPRGARAIGCKWVFKRKVDSEGKVNRWKARLVAQGFAQREGVDFRDTFAPVLHYKTLRALLAIVAVLDYELLQFDVPTAFLNATVEEDVYMKQPPGLEAIGEKEVDPNMVCKLNKAVYGIKQAPHEFYEMLRGSLERLGYQRCMSDTCVFVRTSKTSSRPMIIPIFVDDGFPMCHPDDLVEMHADLKVLMTEYEIKEVANAHVVLGMRVTRDRKARTLKLDQEVYIRRMLEQHGMANCKPAPTPQEERSAKRAASEPAEDEVEEDVDGGWRSHYGSVVGGLLYAALSTRPDIAYAASIRARAISKPSWSDWVAAKRVLRYLAGTASMGLTLGAINAGLGEGVTLAPTFCDADWAGDLEGRVSTTGFVLKLNGATIIWGSKKQITVTLSSAESEYLAAGSAAQEVLWARMLLTELGFAQLQPTVLFSDNQAAIAIASDDVHHARTKHIDIRHHWIRQHIREGNLELQWVASAEQEADILTKPLGRVLFEKLRARVLGM